MAVVNTSIEWTDSTWSPTTGCTKISAGCDNCYAETIAERFRGTAAFPHGFDVQVKANRVNDPLRWRKPRKVFVNSMSDLFHADIDQAWIADIFGVMAAARRHTFQLLTKRHARMRTLLSNDNFVAQVRSRAIGKGLPADQWQWPLPNLWLGVSVENQQWANIRVPELLLTPAAVRFLSCEPLIGPVTLTRISWTKGGGTHLDAVNGRHGVPGSWGGFARSVDWVIVGGESGRKARPMHPSWPRDLRDECAAAGVPFFYKQWGEWAAAPSNYGPDVPERARAGVALVFRGEHDIDGQIMLRTGKGRAGRLLDGREHNEFPAVNQ